MSDENPKSVSGQLQALKAGKGIQYLLNEAYRILGNPVLVHDMEYKKIACTENIEIDDPVWNEFMQHGRLSVETIDFLKNEGFIDDVANSTMQNGVTYLISDKLKYNRVFGQLYNKNNIPVADMIIVGSESPFDENILELTKILCDVLSRELRQSEYYQDYGQAYKENIVRELLEGSITDNQAYTGHIANIDKDLKTNIFIAVADVSRCGSEHSNLVFYRNLFQQAQSNFEYYIYRNYIVILMSWDDDALQNKKKDINKLRRLFEQENIYAGISSGFENLFKAQKYYSEAIEALKFGLNGDGVERIYLYEQL